jgi:hypothetical protein
MKCKFFNIKLLVSALILSMATNLAFAECEAERKVVVDLKSTQNTLEDASKVTAVAGMVVGGILTGGWGALFGLAGLLPGGAAAIHENSLSAAEARLSECLGTVARAEAVGKNRAQSNAQLLANLNREINQRFAPRREEIEREYSQAAQSFHRFIEEEGLVAENPQVRERTNQILDTANNSRTARLAALEQERIQELSRPIESATPGFYRADAAPEVFWVCDGQYCHVPNADTMQCYGWNQVQLINQDRLNRIYVNRTEGPKKRYSGFVRQKNRCEVYKLFDNDKYCGVTDPAQMNRFSGFGQVRVLDNISTVLSGFSYIGSCQG